jgi:hypothetical protein
MDDQQTKPAQDLYITALETRYKNLQAKRDKYRLNGADQIVADIEQKMDKVSEKMIRALTRRKSV